MVQAFSYYVLQEVRGTESILYNRSLWILLRFFVSFLMFIVKYKCNINVHHIRNVFLLPGWLPLCSWIYALFHDDEGTVQFIRWLTIMTMLLDYLAQFLLILSSVAKVAVTTWYFVYYAQQWLNIWINANGSNHKLWNQNEPIDHLHGNNRID